MIYLRDAGLTPYGVAAWPITPAGIDLFFQKAQGRAAVAPGRLYAHAVGAWWGIGNAPGISWEAFIPYVPGIQEAMQQYDQNILDGAAPYPQHSQFGVYLFPLPMTIDTVTGAIDNPFQPDPPSADEGY